MKGYFKDKDATDKAMEWWMVSFWRFGGHASRWIC